ncbi:site-2 protease family protein [Halobacteriaceae archaeon SHR40]|uniref:site-2 protease family protein n=1 Tax=Halovenus amylolytica TaxID=2500550 RepID=UPI000FE380EC
MAGLLTWVLVGIVLYTAVAMGLKARGYLPESVKVSGPLTTIHTKRGRQLLNRLAKRERFWRAWGNVGVGIALVVMVITGIGVLIAVPAIIAQPEAGTFENPQNVLVIPGVNDFLPLSAAPEIIFGLLVGLVVHEGGHGLLCRVEDIEIESMGVATFALIPIGAFVEPDADDQRAADRGAQTRMFAAGITNNLAVCVIAALLLIPIAGSIAVVGGAPVGDTVPGSGAAEAGLGNGDVVTEIDGTPIENASALDTALEANADEELTVERKDGDAVQVDRRLLVLGNADGFGDDIVGTDPLTRVRAVNETTVNTERAFAAAVEDRSVNTLVTTRGNQSLPIGAYIAELPAESALAEPADGAPSDGTPIVVTRLDDRRITNASSYESVRDDLTAGTTVPVELYVEGEQRTFNATVGADGDLGVPDTVLADGYSGFVFDDFGVDPYPADQFLSWLSGENAAQFPAITSVLAFTANLLVLPFATLMDPTSFSYNFAGFTGDVTSFFVVEGPLSMFGPGVFLAANLLFWSWWINFNLALFNCIPAFPLDGGHILRTSTESIISRLPIPRRRTVVTLITGGITLGMVFAVMVLVFGPVLL